MGKYEVNWSGISSLMYNSEGTYLTDVYVTGMMKGDCERFDGTEYILWLMYIHQNGDGDEPWEVTIIPCADDMSSEWDTPYTMQAYKTLDEARAELDKWIVYARNGQIESICIGNMRD